MNGKTSLNPFSVGLPCPAKRASVSDEVWEPEGLAQRPPSVRELARRYGRCLCVNRRMAIPDLAGFRGRRGSALSLTGSFPSFPTLRSSLPNPAGGEAEGLALA